MSTSQRLVLIQRMYDQIHETLARHVDPAQPVATLDFPDIRNCGESAIWLGERAWLKTGFGKEPYYVCRIIDFAADRVIKAFPDRPSIQFPQSIHYRETFYPEGTGITYRANSLADAVDWARAAAQGSVAA